MPFAMYILHCIAIFWGAAQTLLELENSNKSSNSDLSYPADQCTVRVFGEDPILSTKEGFGGDIVKREPANETHDISVVKLTNTPLFHPEFSRILRSTSTCPLWERSHLPFFFFAGTFDFDDDVFFRLFARDMPASRLVGYVCSLDRIHIDDLDKEIIGIPSTNLDGEYKIQPRIDRFLNGHFVKPL